MRAGAGSPQPAFQLVALRRRRRRRALKPQRVRGAGETQRLPGFTYVEYVTGERELYDLNEDPEELRNIAASASPAFLAELRQRLDDLSDCAGDTCRSTDLQALNVTR